MASKKKDLSTAQKVGIGVGLTAAAVAAAGSYFLYGSKDAAKNRKKVKSWMLKAKGEVLAALEDAEAMSKEEYAAMIEQVAGAYGAMKDVKKTDVQAFVKEMKTHWGEIEKQGKQIVKEVTGGTTKTAAKKKPAQKKSAPKKAPAKAKKPAAKKTAKK